MFSKAERITMQLSGIHDAVTQKRATQVLKNLHGVRTASVDDHAVARVTFVPNKTTVSALTEALEKSGFLVI